MNEPNSTPATAAETTLGQDVLALVRHWLRGRGWLLLGLAVAAAGLWIGWPSLVAAGVAPLLLGVLPCVAMCALGVCVMKGGGQSCDAKPGSAAGTDASAEKTRPNLSNQRQETDR